MRLRHRLLRRLETARSSSATCPWISMRRSSRYVDRSGSVRIVDRQSRNPFHGFSWMATNQEDQESKVTGEGGRILGHGIFTGKHVWLFLPAKPKSNRVAWQAKAQDTVQMIQWVARCSRPRRSTSTCSQAQQFGEDLVSLVVDGRSSEEPRLPMWPSTACGGRGPCSVRLHTPRMSKWLDCVVLTDIAYLPG